MSMEPTFNPADLERQCYDAWEKAGYFKPSGVGAPYCIMIPPPNVTGSLHMGHALNNTIQDVLIRRMRMTGRPTRWVLGTDHAGIATQNKVEQKLAKEGLTRYDVGREKFVELCWAWKHEYGGIITRQLRTLGASCDWEREKFTMDESLSAAVRERRSHRRQRGTRLRGQTHSLGISLSSPTRI